MSDKIGILPLARPTFDVPYAEEQFAAMQDQLDRVLLNGQPVELVGGDALLFDAEQTESAIQKLKSAGVDQLLVLQVTFTDAAMLVRASEQIDRPLSIWAIPEPRLGGRLRLNSFCGLNLASHALSLNNTRFSYLYQAPTETCSGALAELLGGKRVTRSIPAESSAGLESDAGRDVVASLQGKRIARIGEHPDGFATCGYSARDAKQLTGISIDELALDELFSMASKADTDRTAEVARQAEAGLSGLQLVDQEQLNRSYKLKVALDDIRQQGSYDAFAIRCWPETFTEYGGAVCGPVSMLGETRVPCACEADVYGAMTQLMLQSIANAPVFLVDLVDLDANDNSGVVWHCGQAPLSMADNSVEPTATIHTNRKMPLLYQFPLKPGRVTFARLSQANGDPKLIISAGEMLKRDMAFTGTSGVIRFDRDADTILSRVMDSGVEHHMGLVYGDYVDQLKSVAASLNLPILEL